MLSKAFCCKKAAVIPEETRPTVVIIHPAARPCAGVDGRWGSPRHTTFDALQRAVLSAHAASAVQLAMGVLICSLFTLIKATAYPLSCVSPTLFCVVTVMMSPTPSLGSRLGGAAKLWGGVLAGVVPGALLSTLSKLLPGGQGSHAASAFMGVMVPAGLVLLAPTRVATGPPAFVGQGMNACLALGLSSLSTWRSPSVAAVWMSAGGIMLSTFVACCTAIGVSVLIAPSLASCEAQDALADVMQRAGVCLSRQASRLFTPGLPSRITDAETGASAGMGCADAALLLDNKREKRSRKEVVIPVTPVGVNDSVTDSLAPPGHYTGSAADSTAVDQRSAFENCAAAAADGGSNGGGGGDGGSDGQPVAEDAAQLYHLGDAAGAAVRSLGSLTVDQWDKLMERNTHPAPPPPPWCNSKPVAAAGVGSGAGGAAGAFSSPYAVPLPPARASSLRPQLAQARTLLASASVEPLWMRSAACGGTEGRWDSAAWERVANTVGVLLTRLSALEALMEDGEVVSETAGPWSSDTMSRLRTVFGTAAAALADAAAAARGAGRSGQQQREAVCRLVSELGGAGGWEARRTELMQLLTRDQAYHWKRLVYAEPGSTIVLPALTTVRHGMFAISLICGLVDTLVELEAAVSEVACGRMKMCSAGVSNTSPPWWQQLLELTCCVHMAACLSSCARRAGVIVARGRQGFVELASSRLGQAGFKYWLVLTLVHTGTMLGMHFAPHLLAPLTPAFGYVAASLAMSERVEATVSKMAFWIAGTLAGGALGLVVMMHPALATNRLALWAILALAAAAAGLHNPTRYRVSVTLCLMTLSAIVLCQCCDTVGHWEYSVARVIAVLSGVLTAAVVCNSLAPWYTSEWALTRMAGLYRDAVALLVSLHARCWADGADGVAGFSGGSGGSPSSVVGVVPVAAGKVGGIDSRPSIPRCAYFTHEEITAARCAADELGTAAAAALPPWQRPALAGGADVACPAVLQTLLARPLAEVQVSLLRDTVAWRRGVLATPPVVPRLLAALGALLDRIAGLQLALRPPGLPAAGGSVPMLVYGLPLHELTVQLVPLLASLAESTATLVVWPTNERRQELLRLVATIRQHRLAMFRTMQAARHELHEQVTRRHALVAGGGANPAVAAAAAALSCAAGDEGACAIAADTLDDDVMRAVVLLLSGADDMVRFLGFQFAIIKAVDKAVAVARLAADESCSGRDGPRSLLR